MDNTQNQPTKLDSANNNRNGGKFNCAVENCFTTLSEDEMPTLAKVYRSVHLIEAGLVTPARQMLPYNYSWAFQAASVLENSILVDKPHLTKFWADQVQNGLHLSEAYLIRNINGFDFPSSIQTMRDDNSFDTVELEANYPYSDMAYASTGQKLQPKSTTDHLIPFKRSLEKPVIAVVAPSADQFDSPAIQRVKSYLSRGFALAVEMDSSAKTFKNYNGSSFIQQECTTFKVNHQATLVGYGTYDGREVWVVKNSYGTGWGAKGTFYTPIGEDNFCLEHSAFTIIPENYTTTLSPNSVAAQQRRQGATALDPDEGVLEQNSGKVGATVNINVTITADGQIFSGVANITIKDKTNTRLNADDTANIKIALREYQFPISIRVDTSQYKAVVIMNLSPSDVANLTIPLQFANGVIQQELSVAQIMLISGGVVVTLSLMIAATYYIYMCCMRKRYSVTFVPPPGRLAPYAHTFLQRSPQYQYTAQPVLDRRRVEREEVEMRETVVTTRISPVLEAATEGRTGIM